MTSLVVLLNVRHSDIALKLETEYIKIILGHQKLTSRMLPLQHYLKYTMHKHVSNGKENGYIEV